VNNILDFRGSVDDFFKHVQSHWEDGGAVTYITWGDVFPVPANVRWRFEAHGNQNNLEILNQLRTTKLYQDCMYSDVIDSDGHDVCVFSYVFERSFQDYKG